MKTISFFNRILVPILLILIMAAMLSGCHLLPRHGHHGHHGHYGHDSHLKKGHHQRAHRY